jgi:hypothetical protein
MKMTATEIQRELSQATGTENYYTYKLPFSQRIIAHYTDGVSHMARMCGGYWLIDAIMSHQAGKIARESFQTWELKKNTYKGKTKSGRDHYWQLIATDGNNNILARQTIYFSDFPLDDIKFYLADSVLMLTSEY